MDKKPLQSNRKLAFIRKNSPLIRPNRSPNIYYNCATKLCQLDTTSNRRSHLPTSFHRCNAANKNHKQNGHKQPARNAQRTQPPPQTFQPPPRPRRKANDHPQTIPKNTKTTYFTTERASFPTLSGLSSSGSPTASKSILHLKKPYGVGETRN